MIAERSLPSAKVVQVSAMELALMVERSLPSAKVTKDFSVVLRERKLVGVFRANGLYKNALFATRAACLLVKTRSYDDFSS